MPDVSFEPYEGHTIEEGYNFELPVEFGGTIVNEEAPKDVGLQSFDITTGAAEAQR